MPAAPRETARAGRRIVCALVPLFPLAARLRSEPELRDEAVVVLAGRGAAARVVAATRRARRAGVRPGFTLSQARARLPKVIARPRDAECERAAQEALLDVAGTFSPRIEDGGEGVVYLDAEGLERLYRSDDPEADPEVELGRALALASERRAGVPVWIGIAASKLAARVAAGEGGVEVVPAGREAEFLAPLPLDRLSSEASTLAVLDRWGIRSLGELASLPPAEVISRLGESGESLHAIARGEDPTPLVPRTPPPVFREGLELEWPLVSLEPFAFVARAALERLTGRMESCGLGCRRLELSMQLEPEGHHERSITLPAPTRDVKTLLTLLRLDLESEPPGAPILSFALTAHPDRPRGAQLSLFGPEALSPDKLATTLARLFSILGDDRVGSPRPEDRHRPEGFRLVPYEPPPPPKTRRKITQGKGLLGLRVLRPPLPVEVMTDALAPTTQPPDVASEIAEIAEAVQPYDAAYDGSAYDGTAYDGSGDQDDASRAERLVGASLDIDPYDPRTGKPNLTRPGHHTPRPEKSEASAEAGRPYEVPGPCDERPVALETKILDDTTKKPKVHGAVKVASGPWVLEEAWWTGEPVERDYWDVELTTGGIYRIFRERSTGDWYVDGIYD